jgi:hypothetical protein
MMDYANGDACVAALVSFFAFWHDIRLANVSRSPTEGLEQVHSMAELSDGLLGLYKEDAIREAIKVLCQKKVLTVSLSTVDRFDRRKRYLFDPDPLNAWIDANLACPEIRVSTPEFPGMYIPGNPGITRDGKEDPPSESSNGNPPSDHSKLVKLWCDSFQEGFGSKYLFTPRDAKHVQTLLKGGKTPDQIIEIAKRAWSFRTDKRGHFNCSKSVSLKGFAEHYNEILTETGSTIQSSQFAEQIQRARERNETKKGRELANPATA